MISWGDDDNDDPSQLLAAAQLKLVDKLAKKAQPPASVAPAKPAKLPTKPLPPAQAGDPTSSSLSLSLSLSLFLSYILWVLKDS